MVPALLTSCASIESRPTLLVPEEYDQQLVVDVQGKIATYYTLTSRAPVKIAVSGPIRLLINIRPMVQAPGPIDILVAQDDGQAQVRRIDAVPFPSARVVSQTGYPGTLGEKRELRVEFPEGDHELVLNVPAGSAHVVAVRVFEE
jgi:hypothetical protein